MPVMERAWLTSSWLPVPATCHRDKHLAVRSIPSPPRQTLPPSFTDGSEEYPLPTQTNLAPLIYWHCGEAIDFIDRNLGKTPLNGVGSTNVVLPVGIVSSGGRRLCLPSQGHCPRNEVIFNSVRRPGQDKPITELGNQSRRKRFSLSPKPPESCTWLPVKLESGHSPTVTPLKPQTIVFSLWKIWTKI